METSTYTLRAALDALAPGGVRAAETSDAVAGVRPRVVVAPAHEEELAAALAFADREGLKVLPRGGGTQLDLGFPPSGGDIVLDMTRLNAILEHTPHDQTVTVQAGVPLAALQASLARAGQWLALDPVLGPAATIGGIVSANASGARRLRFGGVRDAILGIRVALADGTLAKGGGKVVKNVAGYDLPKLFTGALGTLGVVVSATFRLYPLPAASRTVLLPALDLAALGALATRIANSTLVPTAIDLLSPAEGDAYTLAVRFESGIEAAVEQQAAALKELATTSIPPSPPGRGGWGVRSGAEEADFWRRADAHLASPDGASSLLLKVSTPLTAVAPWLEELQRVAAAGHLSMRWRVHAGHGISFARLAGAPDALAGAVDALRAAAGVRQGSLVVQAAPPALAARLDVWGPSPALELMRRLKARFDPRGTLNPGRFLGRI